MGRKDDRKDGIVHSRVEVFPALIMPVPLYAEEPRIEAGNNIASPIGIPPVNHKVILPFFYIDGNSIMNHQ